MMQVAVVAGRVRKVVSVQQILEWAFAVERVSLELPMAEEALIGQGYGIGSSLRLLRRAELGCRVDGGGSSPCHEDAEVVAAAVANLPEGCGGRGMAVRVAELARARVTPDWMPGAVPRVVPADWHVNRHGKHARSEVVGTISMQHRGRKVVHEVRACPITYVPTQAQIHAARRGYLAWWGALLDIRCSLKVGGMLRGHEVSDVMPPRCPWDRGVAQRVLTG